jgi:replicative DNA helicase
MAEVTENTFTAYLGPEFQLRLMWQLLVEPEFAEKTLSNLSVEYFDDPNYRRLFIIILEYYKEFGKVPNLQNQSIQQAINQFKAPNNQIEEESLFAVIKKVQLWNERIINKELDYDGEAIRKTTTTFIKQQEWRKFAEFIIDKTKTGEIRKKHVLGEIDEKLLKISHIGEEEDFGTEVIDNIDRVLRKEFRQTIPTGIRVIDIVTDGGLGKGEIGVILTPSGVGKTTMLTKIANTAYDFAGKNVAQIVFEDTIEQIQRKHFTIWTGVQLSKMDEHLSEVAEKVEQKKQKLNGKGHLVIKKFSQENTTMTDIRNWMIRYEKKWGFKFDMLIVDYLDCLESNKKTTDRTEAELQVIKSFEALAADFNIPAWTAIQTNRSGFDSEYVEAYQTGGSIKRVQKAHFFMSVAKTADQKEAGLANIRIIKARFAQDGQTFRDSRFNNDTMEIVIEDERYPIKTTGIKTTDVENIEDIANKVSSQQKIAQVISEKYADHLDNVNDDVIIEKKNELEEFKAAWNREYVEVPKVEKEPLIVTGNVSEIPETLQPIIMTNNENIKPSGDYFDWNGESGETKTELTGEIPVVKTDDLIIIEEEKPQLPKENKIILTDPDSLESDNSNVLSVLEHIRKNAKSQDIMKKD